MLLCAGIKFIYYKLNNDTLHLFYLTVHGELKTWAVVSVSACVVLGNGGIIDKKVSLVYK